MTATWVPIQPLPRTSLDCDPSEVIALQDAVHPTPLFELLGIALEEIPITKEAEPPDAGFQVLGRFQM